MNTENNKKTEEIIRELFNTFEKDNDEWKTILDSGGEYLARKHSPKSPEYDLYVVYEDDLKELIKTINKEIQNKVISALEGFADFYSDYWHSGTAKDIVDKFLSKEQQ